jgi:hypothetical protein
MSAREQPHRLGRPDEVRRGNERIAQRAEQLRFVSRVPMLCECSDPACSQIVLIALDAYHRLRSDSRRYLTAAEHTLERTTDPTRHP